MLNSISNLSNSIIEKFGIMDKTVRDLTSGEPIVDSISFNFPFIVSADINTYVLDTSICVALNVLNRAHWIEYSFQNKQIKHDKKHDNFYISKSIPLAKPNALSFVQDLPGILQNDMIPALIAKSIYAQPYKRFSGVLKHNRIAYDFVEAFVQQSATLSKRTDLWEDDEQLSWMACNLVRDFSDTMTGTIKLINDDFKKNLGLTV